MHILLRSLVLSAAGALALGCAPDVVSGDTSGGGGGSGGATASTSSTTSTTGEGGAGGTGPGPGTLTADWGPHSIPSGEEAVKCIVVALDNEETVLVRRFRTTLEEGSHHMIVYKSDKPPNPTPFACQSFGVQGGSAIFIAQQAESELVFPSDENGTPVGLELGPHQSLTLEVHYINATAAPLDVKGTVTMDVLPATANVVKSGLLFQGNLSIPTIPAFGEADTGMQFEQVPSGIRVFSLTTHQHKLGTRMQVWHATDANDTSTPVADSTSWSDPPLMMYDPPLVFPADGSKGFAYDCHWKNPTDKAVSGGLSANDEMCFFWSYFYPSP